MTFHATSAESTILAIDAGTTGITALLFDHTATVVGRGYQEFDQHFVQPGWVEHDLDNMWAATCTAVRAALTESGHRPVAAVGITNQRETICAWTKSTLAAPTRAIVWQDRRTAGICADLRRQGHETRIAELTGLRLDPYFSATKIMWWAQHKPELFADIQAGRVLLGTVESYLVARLSGGTAHITDVSNASRTLLFDTEQMCWSQELCDLFGVPMAALPQVTANWGELATVQCPDLPELQAPITGMAGDQQAALFGQGCFAPGDSKCTYGTGSFVLTNTGPDRAPALPGAADDGLLTTVAWQSPAGTTTYAREGSIFVTGSAVQWLRDGLGIIDSAADVEQLAAEAGPDAAGVTFVPALTGLGAPHWSPESRGLILGVTRGTTAAHIARATLDAICCQVRDVVEAAGVGQGVLRVDGGASANNMLMQLQAEHLHRRVQRPVVAETTALGAAMLAGLGAGIWSDTAQLQQVWQLDQEFVPTTTGQDAADQVYGQWSRAVNLCLQFAQS